MQEPLFCGEWINCVFIRMQRQRFHVTRKRYMNGQDYSYAAKKCFTVCGDWGLRGCKN